MKIYLVATLIYPECLGLFYLRAFRTLGHEVDVWDPRTMPRPPRVSKPDLTVVIKEFVNPLALPCPRVYIFPDQVSHENYEVTLNMIVPNYDAVYFCMKHPEALMQKYHAKLLPFGVDRRIHAPLCAVKDIPVSFIGTNRLGRPDLMSSLAKNGVQVKVWGNNWPPQTPNYMGPAVYLDEKRRICSRSEIALNHHYRNIGPNMRVYEAPGLGCFMLSDTVEGMAELGFRDGVHYASYSNDQDSVDKVKYYLANKDERRKIAVEGCTFVHQKHTYENRVRELIGREI
jgi:hypothetical protein